MGGESKKWKKLPKLLRNGHTNHLRLCYDKGVAAAAPGLAEPGGISPVFSRRSLDFPGAAACIVWSILV